MNKMAVQIGKPKTSGGKNVFKIEDGDNVFRVLPPMKSLAKAGRWSVYYPVQWGFKNSKGENRPFVDPRSVNYKTKMVEVESDSYRLREALKKLKSDVVEKFKAGTATKQQVEKMDELVRKYNLDAKHYLNVVNLKGEIGLLKINASLKKALDAAIKTYQSKKGPHPLFMGEDGMTGLYFTFHRSNATGKLNDWVFSVTPYLESRPDGGLFEKTHTMDAAFLERLEDEAYDLASIYPTPTAEEVASMVDLSTLSVRASAVDAVLGSRDGSVSESSEESEEEEQASAVPVAPVATPVAAPVVQSAPAVPVEPAAPSVPVTQAAPAESADSSDLSELEFLKTMGVQGL